MEYISLIWDVIKKIWDIIIRRQKRSLQTEDEKRRQKQIKDNKMEELLVQTLSNHEKLQTAANFAGQKGSLDKIKEVSGWFEEFCLSYRDEHPFQEFEFLKKFFAGYTSDPILFAAESLEMFERLTQLRVDINELIKELREKKNS